MNGVHPINRFEIDEMSKIPTQHDMAIIYGRVSVCGGHAVTALLSTRGKARC